MTGRVNVGGVEIDIRADGSLLIADLKRAEDQARRFADRASGSAKKVKTDGFDPLGRAVGDVRGQLIALASIGALAGLASQALKAADAFSGMRSRLSLVVREGENLLDVEENLAQLALKNRADLNATVSLYTRLRTARKDLDDATTTQILDAWSKTLVISGANATEAASATLQFAQAMGSGKLQGAELTAVLENNSRASSLIAEKMKVPIGALKKLGEEGKLTTEILIDIFTNAGALDGEFNKMAMTVSQAGTNFETSFTRVVGLLDQSVGISRTLAGWIDGLSKSILDIGVAIGGPIAQAQDALKKFRDANQAVINDTELLEAAHKKVTEAMKGQDVIAQNTARLELAAIQTRIAGNRELAKTYAMLLRVKLSEAQAQVTAYDNSMNDPYSADMTKGEQRDRLNSRIKAKQNLDIPLNKGEVRFLEEENRIAQMRADANELKSIISDIENGKGLTVSAAAIDKFSKSLAEIRASKDDDKKKSEDAAAALIEYAKAAGAAAEAIDLAIKLNKQGLVNDDDLAKLKKSLGPSSGGTGDDDKKKVKSEFTEYTSAAEKFDGALTRLRATKEADLDKSRAAVTLLQEYISATGDFEGAEARLIGLGDILSGGDWGTLWENLQRARSEAGEITSDEGFVKSVLDGYGNQDELIAQSTQQTLSSLPEFEAEPSYFEGFEENVRSYASAGLQNAILSGDFGASLRDVIGNAASEGFSRAVDKLVNILFDLPWDEILGDLGGEGGGLGDILGAIGTAIFGGAKAGGGDVMGGRAYRVGELGPEMFVPSTNGFILPNRTGSVVGAGMPGGASSITVGGASIVINGNADGVTVRQLEAALAEHRRALPAAIDARVINRRMKGAY